MKILDFLILFLFVKHSHPWQKDTFDNCSEAVLLGHKHKKEGYLFLHACLQTFSEP